MYLCVVIMHFVDNTISTFCHIHTYTKRNILFRDTWFNSFDNKLHQIKKITHIFFSKKKGKHLFGLGLCTYIKVLNNSKSFRKISESYQKDEIFLSAIVVFRKISRTI